MRLDQYDYRGRDMKAGAMAALTRVAAAYEPYAPGPAYNPVDVDVDFIELICDLADPLPDHEGWATYANVRWHADHGLHVIFRKVSRTEVLHRHPVSRATKVVGVEYGHVESYAHFDLHSAEDCITPDLVDVAIGWGPENGYTVAWFLMALGQLFPKGE